jgi:hypothetical protein
LVNYMWCISVMSLVNYMWCISVMSLVNYMWCISEVIENVNSDPTSFLKIVMFGSCNVTPYRATDRNDG